jgi:hypothetical protein
MMPPFFSASNHLLWRQSDWLVSNKPIPVNVFFIREDCAPDYLPPIHPKEILNKDRARKIRTASKSYLSKFRWSVYE